MKTKYAVVVATILLATTACGGSPGTATTTDQDVDVPDVEQQFEGRALPGATGEVADIDGRTLQVQNPMEGQVAVTWTGDTSFTEQVEASASDLDVGDCVMVDGEGTDVLTATSVRITPAVDGSCEPGGGGGGPRFEGDAPPEDGTPPAGAPDRMMMMGAFGQVSAINDGGFTVEAAFAGQPASSRQVSTTEATTWSDTVSSSAKSLEVGMCVTARGDRDDTGAVTADSIAVSQPVEGDCLGGMVRRLS